MPRKAKQKGYFYQEQEEAVVEYIQADTKEEKDKIFNHKLKYPFTKLVESIIRRYKLYVPDEEYNETFDDTMSFLLTKIDCFNPEANFKAYSYLGTIAKNYLLFRLSQYTKNRNRSIPYDVMQETFQDNLEYSYGNPLRQENVAGDLIKEIVHKIQYILDNERETLSTNEIKVGYAMRNLFTNWEDLFVHVGSNKFNKSSILLYLKESTLLQTKDIREASKRFKEAYFAMKADFLSK